MAKKLEDKIENVLKDMENIIKINTNNTKQLDRIQAIKEYIKSDKKN